MSELTENTQSTAGQYAEFYALEGYSVVPCSRHGKRPLLPWKEHQERRLTLVELDDWYTASPNDGVGIVTGQASGGLVVIDADAKGDLQRVESLAYELGRLGAVHGDTLTACTPGGGFHLYYTYPEPLPTRVAMLPGVDVRAEAGFVVAPPTAGYSWAYEGSPVERLPDELAALIRGGV